MDFIKVASACPVTKVSDVDYNVLNILKCIDDAEKNNSKFIVFPELAITSYTCGDLFLQDYILQKAVDGIKTIAENTKEKDILIAVGAPLLKGSILYNCAVILFKGTILGVVPTLP